MARSFSVRPAARKLAPKPVWILTREALDCLLIRLHPDRESASQAYQELRGKVITFLEGRRCAFPEELADETLNRVARKLVEGVPVADLNRYALGVARNVLQESYRQPARATLSLDELPPQSDLKASREAERAREDAAEEEQRLDCMRRCLHELPADQHDLLIEYYQDEKRARIDHHKEMAERLGLTPNALYLQVHRLREKLASRLEALLRQS
jgi:RNA polymerase sigma factor (sigma-70 family)